MKKIVFFLAAFISLKVAAQSISFYKGALVTEANYGLDIYNVHYHYESKGITPAVTKDQYNKA
ncbi:MAG TPA: hypothetical protein VNY73_03085, partial [Bacteroidia bacterium]|nr:hypothetical protein [Bacteroidia bacterium]